MMIKHIFLIDDNDLPEEGGVYAEQILYEKLFRYEDVKRLETENAKLRERVGELLGINKRLWEINSKMFPIMNEVEDFLESLKEIGDIDSIVDDAIQAGKENLSSPVDVEKGDSGDEKD